MNLSLLALPRRSLDLHGDCAGSWARRSKTKVSGNVAMDYQDLAPVQLARLCAQKDSEAWLEFICRYQRPITLVILRTLRKAGSTPTLVIDDLVQETYAALCADGLPLLRDFVEEYPSSLDAMVRAIAANLTHDYLRAQNAKKRGGDFHQVAYNSRALAQLPSPYGHETIELHQQLKEIDATLEGHQTPSARDRAIFWLHFRLGMTANAIARVSTFQLTSKGVESSLRRTLSMVRTALKDQSRGS
jgi:RNA polymerase sigma-70 factor (ECF subfamily)